MKYSNVYTCVVFDVSLHCSVSTNDQSNVHVWEEHRLSVQCFVGFFVVGGGGDAVYDDGVVVVGGGGGGEGGRLGLNSL